MKILTTISVLMFAFISIITTLRLRNYLRYRSKKKIARNKYTRMIEDTNHCHWGSRPDLPYLNVRSPIYDQSLVIDRQLSIKEFCQLSKERYADKDGWRLSRYAYLLKNTCPECGRPLYATYQSSPLYTWANLCGRAGILVYCPHCHADLNFFLYVLNSLLSTKSCGRLL